MITKLPLDYDVFDEDNIETIEFDIDIGPHASVTAVIDLTQTGTSKASKLIYGKQRILMCSYTVSKVLILNCFWPLLPSSQPIMNKNDTQNLFSAPQCNHGRLGYEYLEVYPNFVS